MKKIDLGQTLSILANVGVIAGIVILVIEIRDSNNLARVTNQIAVSSLARDWYLELGTDPGSAEIYLRGRSGYSQLSEVEKSRFNFLIRADLERLTIGTTTARVGLGFTGSDFEPRQMEIMLEQEGFSQWWSEVDRRTLPIPTVRLLEQVEQSAR